MDKLVLEDLPEDTHINVVFTVSKDLELTAHVGTPRAVHKGDGYLEFTLTAGTAREWSLRDSSNFGGATLTGWAYPLEKIVQLFEHRCNVLRAQFHAHHLQQLMEEIKSELYREVKRSEISAVKQVQINAWLWEQRQRWEIDTPQPDRGPEVAPAWFGSVF